LIKAVVFDLDNTLIDSVDTIWMCADHVLRSNGYSGVDRRTAEKAMGLTIFDLFSLAEPGIGTGTLEKLAMDYRKCYMDFHSHSRVIPHARRALEETKKRGLRMALVTTKSRDNVLRIMKAFCITDYFEVVVGFEDTKNHKPSPEPILKAASLLKVGTDGLLVVGDTDMDVRAGKAAGATTVAVLTGVTPLEKIEAEKPDYTIKNLQYFEKILDGALPTAGDR
jgi:HAD superfamily hydrolase (TIGR01509 family)